MTLVQLTIPGGTAPPITTGGITFTTTGSYGTGTTVDGDTYVIAPNSVYLASSTPTEADVSGRKVNGMQKNPERSYTDFQALDSEASQEYDASKQVSYPLILAPNDCVVKADSLDPLITATRGGTLTQAAGLHVVAAAKSPLVFAAPYVWPVSDLANRPWRVADVDLLLAALTTFDTSAQQEATWAHLEPFLGKFNVGKAMTPNTGPGGYEYLTVHPVGDDLASNYDEYQTRTQALMLMGMMGQTWSTADKTAAAITLLRRGCQEGEASVAVGGDFSEDGRHYASQYAPCMAWLLATGQTSEYETWMDADVGGNVIGQYYLVTAGQFDPHSSASLPYIARLRNVTEINTGVAGANCQVKTQGFSPASGLTGDTASNAEWRGLNLVKNSGGNLALVNSFTQGANGADHTFELAAPITGLIVGDAVFGQQVSAMAVGTPDFSVRNAATYPNLPNPSLYAEYRDRQNVAIAHLFCHNIGMSGARASTAVAYMVRAMSGAAPTQCGIVNSTVTGSSNTWAAQFYTAFAATLLAKTQIV